jgi:hypothetical protein
MKEKRIKVGNKEMIITKDDTGQLVSVKDQDGNDVESGTINDLKLANEKEKNRTLITEVADDTLIHTHSSPGCSWYFYNRRWYKICT